MTASTSPKRKRLRPRPARWVPPTGRDALRLAEQVRERSQRTNIPLTKSFVRASAPGIQPMLYRLYAGGRSGIVAVKLYLALVWRCSAPPYSSRRDSARAWATLLDLDDPGGKGARRVRSALQKLEDLELVRIDEDPGYPPTVTLLAEAGDGTPYEPASTRSFKMNRGRDTPDSDSYYFQVPAAMWTQGYIQALSGPGMVMYLALACEQAYRRDQWFSTEQFPERFLFSAQTRAEGTKELKQAGLLRVTSKMLDEAGQTVSFGRMRRRNSYRLTGAAVPAKD